MSISITIINLMFLFIINIIIIIS